MSEISGTNGAGRGLVTVDWIAARQDGTNLQAWGLDSQGQLLTKASLVLPQGQPLGQFWENQLMQLIEPWLGQAKQGAGARKTPVLICGLGLDAALQPVPTQPTATDRQITLPVLDPRIEVFAIPGLSQKRPPDLVQGPETAIAGALALDPKFDGVICLPGQTTVWAHISAGEVVSFQSYMTGDLLDLLLGQPQMARAISGSQAFDTQAFDEALADALSNPGRISGRLSAITAAARLNNLGSGSCLGMLKGLLLGIELAAARPYWLGQDVWLIGASETSALWQRALAAQGVKPKTLDETACLLAGMAKLHLLKS